MLGNSPAGQREPRCLEEGDTYPGWSLEPGKAMEGAGAPGLPFALQPGMTKPWLIPAGPGLEAQLSARRRRISHASLLSLHRARETLLGCQGSPGQSPGELSKLSATSAAFSPLSSFPSEDDVLLLRQKGVQTQHRCPAASPPASSSSSSTPRSPQGFHPPAPPPPAGSPPLPALLLLPFLLQGCGSLPLRLTEVP